MRHVAEPILLLAHEDREKLARRPKVAIEYRTAEPVYDPAAFAQDCFKEIVIEKGRLERGFAEADLVVEGEYRVRPPGAALHRDRTASSRCRRTAASRFTGRSSARTTCTGRCACSSDLPPEKVRVVQTETGGGFGGKEEYPSMIAGHAACSP